MIVVHGSYLPSFASSNPGLFLWGEGELRENVHRDRHPRSVDAAVLEAALRARAIPGVPLARLRAARLSLVLPAWRGRPVPSSPSLRGPGDYAAGTLSYRTFEAEALVAAPAETLDVLLGLPDGLRAGEGALHPGDDLEYWSEAARWIFDLLRRRRVAPAFDDGTLRWRPTLADPHEKDRFTRFAAAFPTVARTAVQPAGDARPAARPETFPTASAVLKAFLDEVTDGAARSLLRSILPAERRRHGTSVEAHLVGSLAAGSPAEASPVEVPPDLRSRLNDWALPLIEPLAEGDLGLLVRLHPPALREADLGPETARWTLRYLLESTEDPSLQIPAEDVWGAAESSFLALGRRFSHPQERLLARLGAAAPLCPPIARSLEERHPVGAELDLSEAYRFLTREAPLLSEAGVRLVLPAEGRLTKVGVRLTASDPGQRPESAVTRFGLSTLVDFDWRVAIGDVLLPPDEFEELAARKIPLVSVRGEWVLLEPESVARTLKLFDRRPSSRTTLVDLLRMAGGLEAEPGAYPIDALSAEGWLGAFLSPATTREEILAFEVPSTLQGTLRPYQVRGVSWLRFLTSRGLGACLADDMGLGKTVQFLATLLAARECGEAIRPSLLICPTSVAENWLREAARFAPSLHVAIHHGPERASGAALGELLERTDLLVTTYPLAHRDRSLLAAVTWEYLALDEAQNVKNPAAAQSRAVRSLRARRRAALTGTPVENRLSELKAIFDCLNPGLLGTDEEFRAHFVLPIEKHRDPEAVARLKRISAPFFLRRTKVDPAIAPDLPSKIETKELVGLTREQATLYRATTRSILEGIGRTTGRSRRAKVLLLLLRLKQICNHPAHFLSDGSRLEGRSSKLARLLEMLEETLSERSPALLFTQFAEMGHLLVRALRDRFGAEVLFLHGAVPRKARFEMIRRFQEDDDPPPFFILSLKAGGSGLNLTRASHVFHFDRWWNPAVEDQATDRAFRLGQTQTVHVHKFVCRGTLEERIDGMIEEKKALARSIVGAGEGWIANLSDAELLELVALSRDAVDSEAGR